VCVCLGASLLQQWCASSTTPPLPSLPRALSHTLCPLTPLFSSLRLCKRKCKEMKLCTTLLISVLYPLSRPPPSFMFRLSHSPTCFQGLGLPHAAATSPASNVPQNSLALGLHAAAMGLCWVAEIWGHQQSVVGSDRQKVAGSP